MDGPSRFVTLANGTEIGCRALLIATGIAFRKVDVPGVEELTGAGVYYYAPMTEALSYKNEDVYIVGGANSAGQAAMYFSKYARSVTMLVRSDSLSANMSQYLEDQIGATKNIVVRLNTSVLEVKGSGRCETITLMNNKTCARETVPASALLFYVGAIPYTDWLAGVVERDAQGYIFSGAHLLREGKRPGGWAPTAIRSCLRPACREFLWPATCAMPPPKVSPPEWEKAQWPSNSSTSISARCNPWTR